MNDKKIITQKERNYIETLYLYCNIQDFEKNKENHSSYAYWNMKEYLKSTLLHTAEHIGTAKGREWYQLPNYRLGLMEYDTAKSANQYNLVIQYEQKHMWELDKNLSNLDLPFDGALSDYKIKRIDVTKIAQHSEDYIENHNYISPYRSKRYEQGTIYLGHRKNGNVFRLYDKTKELLTDTKEHPIDYKKIALLSEYFGDIENLWTYELELSRSYLKENLNIDTLADLQKVYSAYQNIVGQIRIYKDTDKNKKLLAQGNRDRIKGYILSDFVEYERVKKKAYKPSYAYLLRNMKKDIKNYLAKIEENNIDFYMRLITDLTDGEDLDGKELTFWFENSDLATEKAQMTAKYELLRENQGNDLEIEAKNEFRDLSDKQPVQVTRWGRYPRELGIRRAPVVVDLANAYKYSCIEVKKNVLL